MEKHNQVNRFRPGLGVGLLVAVGEPAALRLERLHQSPHKASYPRVASGAEVILRGRLAAPPIAWVILSLAEKDPASAQQMLMCQCVQQQE